MPRILSQAGNSLADIYDVRGSIAGIDDLETRELGIIHEMGATVQSERFLTAIRRVPVAPVAQSLTMTGVIVSGSGPTDLPLEVTRLLGVQVFTDDVSRVNNMALLARQPDAVLGIQEFPLWVWDGSGSTPVRFIDDAIESTPDMLTPILDPPVPTFCGGAGQTNQIMVKDLVLRGNSSAFGAGTVLAVCLLYLAVAVIPGTRSRGLPIPSW